VLRRVHDVHVALTARMREAEATSDALSNVGPLRAALAQVFERVVVRWPTPQDFDDPTVFEVPGVAGWPFLEPILRRDVFDAGAETRADQWSTVRRVALDLGVEPAALEPGAGGVGDDDNNQTGSGVPL